MTQARVSNNAKCDVVYAGAPAFNAVPVVFVLFCAVWSKGRNRLHWRRPNGCGRVETAVCVVNTNLPFIKKNESVSLTCGPNCDFSALKGAWGEGGDFFFCFWLQTPWGPKEQKPLSHVKAGWQKMFCCFCCSGDGEEKRGERFESKTTSQNIHNAKRPHPQWPLKSSFWSEFMDGRSVVQSS